MHNLNVAIREQVDTFYQILYYKANVLPRICLFDELMYILHLAATDFRLSNCYVIFKTTSFTFFMYFLSHLMSMFGTLNIESIPGPSIFPDSVVRIKIKPLSFFKSTL